MDRLCKAALLLGLTFVLCGCRSYGRLFPPAGSVQQQRHNAAMFDPFTDVESGPEVVGGRPRDFQDPLPESERTRLLQNSWFTTQ